MELFAAVVMLLTSVAFLFLLERQQCCIKPKEPLMSVHMENDFFGFIFDLNAADEGFVDVSFLCFREDLESSTTSNDRQTVI